MSDRKSDDINFKIDPQHIKAPVGDQLHCKNWLIEAPFRMLLNNLDSDVAENPKELIVYGGRGKAARNWDAFHHIIQSLLRLNVDETLLVQSGKAIGIAKSHEDAPRVLISNSMLVPAWATWEKFRELEALGLMMYGQMTAGSWIYIGTQGILQGTYETFAEAGRKYFHAPSLSGKFILSAGLGGMGGAQGLAATMNGAVFLGVEVDRSRIEKRIQSKYCDLVADNFEHAMSLVKKFKEEKVAKSIAIHANAADIYSLCVAQNIIPDIVTDQTSTHDMLNGYVPSGISYEDALSLRKTNPKKYIELSVQTVGKHVRAMLEFKKRGSVVFDYGNNIREEARKAGVKNAFDIPGFVVEFIRPLFCEGKGPFRWVALSGDPEDIYTTDLAIMELFPENKSLHLWLKKAKDQVAFQGLPSRICWLGYGEREKAGLLFNDLVKNKKVKAPIVIGRDHLDCGSVASPNRETEGMLDGSDAVADWPILNALINAVNGATWVSVHHGGGVGIGYSIHAGMVIVADGTDDARLRLSRVLNSDPLMGIFRHADAGYEKAIEIAKRENVKIPSVETLDYEKTFYKH